MSTTGTSFRRGTSTILGTLIFVGIIFTAVIPMMLVMRQADTLQEMRKHELEILDQERAMESLCLYVCPESLESPNLEVMIVNNCEVLVRVVSLWINNETFSMEIDIPSMSEKVLDPFVLDLLDGAEYDIRATTDRGNLFPSENGILHYEDGSWDLEEFSIRIHTGGIFLRIQVWMDDFLIFDERDFIGAGYEVIVPEPCEYQVKVWEWWTLIYDEPVTITWPLGEPWVDVYP